MQRIRGSVRRVHAWATGAATLALLVVFEMAPVVAAHLYVDPQFGVNVTTNVQYGISPTGLGVDVARFLDVYEPTGAGVPDDRPAIVLMHGGFFVSGDKGSSTMSTYANEFASRGYTAVSINYRLLFDDDLPDPPGAPITPVPARFPSWLPAQLASWGITVEDYLGEIAAAVEDQAMAVNFLAANTGTYNIDPQRIAVGGYSAGAVSSLALGAGVVDSVSADVGAVFSMAGGLFGQEPFVDPSDPGVFVLHGTSDTTVPYSEVPFLEAALNAEGVPYESHIVSGAGHGSSTLVSSLLADPDPFFEFMIEQLDTHALPPLAGDVNKDGIVNGLDANLVSSHFLMAGSYDQGDLNIDSVVNGLDANIISANFLATAPATAIPEPTSGLLFLCGVALLVWRRR